MELSISADDDENLILFFSIARRVALNQLTRQTFRRREIKYSNWLQQFCTSPTDLLLHVATSHLATASTTLEEEEELCAEAMHWVCSL